MPLMFVQRLYCGLLLNPLGPRDILQQTSRLCCYISILRTAFHFFCLSIVFSSASANASR